jgi:DNA-binding NarL/FixJ family response regulator
MHVNYLVEALSQTRPSVNPNIADRRALGKREEEILRLVATGVTDREISNSLKLNEKETKKCLSDLLDKLGLSSRSELMFLFSPGRSQPFELEKKEVSKKDSDT